MKFRNLVISAFIASLLIVPSLPVQAATTSVSIPPAGNANLKVIDVSHWNVPYNSTSKSYDYSKINWSTLKSDINAIYMKATDGRTWTDPTFSTLASSAQSAKISHGYYHFFRPNTDLSVDRQQADFFNNTIKNYGYDCVPMLDVEVTQPYDGAAELSKDQISSAVKAFADEFKAKSGQDVMLYSYSSFISDYFNSTLSGYKLWIADYGSTTYPRLSSNSIWSSYDMWQYTDNLTVSGWSGTVDGDKATSNILLGTASGISWVDSPSGTYYPGDITVSGWAISHYGISRVDIYVDGVGMGSVNKADFIARSDIEDSFGGSGYEDALNSGYSFTIPDGKLSNGTHTVRVATIDDRGNAVWSNAKTFTLNLTQASLESPSGTYTDDIGVSGWAVSQFGVSRVDLYCDGKQTGTISHDELTERTDIESKFAGVNYTDMAHSGFTYTIPNENLTGGTHTLSAVVIDNMGNKVSSSTKTFTVTSPNPALWLDTPVGTYTGNINVNGWAISHFGVKRVDVYVDGKGMGSVYNDSFTERIDIEKLFSGKGYNDLTHSGFSYTIPDEKLAGGKHTVRVAMIDNSGKVLWSNLRSFNVTAPSPLVNIDAPNGSVGGNINVSGWAISHFGVKRVDVYVDGKGMGSAYNNSFTERTDIEKLFGGKGYNDLTHSGFSYVIAQGRLTRGTHSVRVAMIDYSGKVLWSSGKTFTVTY